MSSEEAVRSENYLDDPNFAIICSFLQCFGKTCNIEPISFNDLQEMLENTSDVATYLAQLHILLLRRVYRSINADKWEKHLAKFCHSYNSQDGWEIERFGYKKSKIQTKLRLLKNLLEAQFDYNSKFKNEVNKLPAADLRRTPMGHDSEGQAYWLQVDSEANLRIYREDGDEDSWELVATNKAQMLDLISALSSGIVVRNSVPAPDIENGDASPKENILLDTGKEEEEEGEQEDEEDDDEESMMIDEDYVPQNEEDKTSVENSKSPINPISQNEKESTLDDSSENSPLLEVTKGKIDNNLEVEDLSISKLANETATTSMQVLEKEETKSNSDNNEEIRPTLENEQVVNKSKDKAISKKGRKIPKKGQNKNETKSKDSKISTLSNESSLKVGENIQKSQILAEKNEEIDDISSPQILNEPETLRAISEKAAQKITSSNFEKSQIDSRAESHVIEKIENFETQNSEPCLEMIKITTTKNKASEILLMDVEKRAPEKDIEKSQDENISEEILDQSQNVAIIDENIDKNQNEGMVEEKIQNDSKEASTSKEPKELTHEASKDSGIVLNEVYEKNSYEDLESGASSLSEVIEVSASESEIIHEESEKSEIKNLECEVLQHKNAEVLNSAEISENEKLAPEVIVSKKIEVADIISPKISEIESSSEKVVESDEPLESENIDNSQLSEVSNNQISENSPSEVLETSQNAAADSTDILMSEAEDLKNSKNENVAEGVSLESSMEIESQEKSEKEPQKINIKSLRAEEEVAQNSDISNLTETQSLVLAETLEVHNSGISNLSETQSLELSKTEEKEFKEYEISNLSETQSLELSNTDVNNSEISNLSETQGLDLSKEEVQDSEISNLSETQGLDLSKEEVQDSEISNLSQTQDLDISKEEVQDSEISNLSQTQYLNISKEEVQDSEISNLSETQSLELSVSADVVIENYENSNSAETQGLELSKTEVKEIPSSEISNLSENQSLELSIAEEEVIDNSKNSNSGQTKSLELSKREEETVQNSEVSNSGETQSLELTNTEEEVIENSKNSNSGETQSLELLKPEEVQNSEKSDKNEESEKSTISQLFSSESTTQELSSSKLQNSENSENETSASLEVNEEICTKSTAWQTGSKSPQNKNSESQKISPQISTKNNPLVGLIGYSSSEDEEEIEKKEEGEKSEQVLINPNKRKAEKDENNDNFCQNSKNIRLDSSLGAKNIENEKEAQKFNSIVGEEIEEEILFVSGQGAGAECEGGAGAVSSDEDSEEEEEEEEEEEVPVKKRRGRPKGKVQPKAPKAPKKLPDPGAPPSKRGRKKKEIGGGGGGGVDLEEVGVINNGKNERPTRQSSRIAKIQEKEEEERRRLEEERLAQLKEAQMRKKMREEERESIKVKGEKNKDVPKSGLKTVSFRKSKYVDGNSSSASSLGLPEPNSEEEGGGGGGKKVLKKRGRKKKNDQPKTLMKMGLNPWTHSSSEDEEGGEEEEEEFHYEEPHEEEEGFKSDHEFSPESDLEEEEDGEASPSRHARTVQRGEAESEDKYAQTNCRKCTKGDHPEWILLCDSCDYGWHASCLRPQLWVIPEGQWFCPPCQHKMLVEKLGSSLSEYEKHLTEHEAQLLRKKEELAALEKFNLENSLIAEQNSKNEKSNNSKNKKNKRRRREEESSDDEEDELMMRSRVRNRDSFIDEREDESEISEYSSSKEEEEEEEPMYKLRARKATKSFNFKEYDEMIASALRDEDAELSPIDSSAALLKNNENLPPVKAPPNPPKSKGKVLPGSPSSSEDEEDGKKSAKKQKNKKNDDDDDEEEEEEEKSEEENEISKKNEEEEEEKEEGIGEKSDKKVKKGKEGERSSSSKKGRRRLNDLDASSGEDSGSEFLGTESEEGDEDDENFGVDDEEEWSGEESEESLSPKRRKKGGKYGREEKYLEVGSVRRSTRKARSRVIYDESEQEDDDDDGAAPWATDEESGVSESNSESDDATWGRRKKGGAKSVPKPKIFTKANFFMTKSPTKGSGKKRVKKRKVDEDEEDRPWSKHGGKVKKNVADAPEDNKRSTRGKQIDFKVILESGESDDDGNIVPKRKRPRASDYESNNESDGPSSSKKILEELKQAQKPTNIPKQTPKPLLPDSDSSSEPEEKIKKIEPNSVDLSTLPPVLAPPLPPNLKKSEEVLLHNNESLPLEICAKIEKKSISSPIPEMSPTPTPVPLQIPNPAPVPNNLPLNLNNSSISPISSLNSPLITPVTQPSTNLMMSEILSSTPQNIPKSNKRQSKKSKNEPVFPSGVVRGALVSSSPTQGHHLVAPTASEISRVPNPAYFPPNQTLRFPWDRMQHSPPPPYPPRGRSPGQNIPIGPPPHLNSHPFPPRTQPPPRGAYGQPPPLRIPNPGGGIPVAAHQPFQDFKRDGGMMYRMGRAGPPSNILAHLQSSHERFFGPHGGFPGAAPYAQPLYHPPQQPFDYNRSEGAVSPSGKQSPNSSSVPDGPISKEEPKGEVGEFDGLVSYFSSQRGDDDEMGD